eukprot:77334-Prymnesium_polylepis.1
MAYGAPCGGSGRYARPAVPCPVAPTCSSDHGCAEIGRLEMRFDVRIQSAGIAHGGERRLTVAIARGRADA